MIKALGKITVPSAGTPVRITLPSDFAIHGIMVQAWRANVGMVFVGAKYMDISSGVGLYAQIPAPTDAFIGTFSAALTIAPNGLNTKEFWIDADENDDAVIVSVLVT